jgi:chromosome segregation ATPase
MSTAGKVLSVIVLLSIIAWTVLAAGVAQLNYNAITDLEKTIAQVAKLKDEVAQNRDQFVALRDQTILAQEKMDRDLAVLHAKQADVYKARSQVLDTLSGLKYQLEVVESTIKSAIATFENRSTEARDEEKALADARAGVKSLDQENTQLMARLQTLRDQFKTTYKTNLGMVGPRQ